MEKGPSPRMRDVDALAGYDGEAFRRLFVAVECAALAIAACCGRCHAAHRDRLATMDVRVGQGLEAGVSLYAL